MNLEDWSISFKEFSPVESRGTLVCKPFHQELWRSRKKAQKDVSLYRVNMGIFRSNVATVASRVTTLEDIQQSGMLSSLNGHATIVEKRDV